MLSLACRAEGLSTANSGFDDLQSLSEATPPDVNPYSSKERPGTSQLDYGFFPQAISDKATSPQDAYPLGLYGLGLVGAFVSFYRRLH